MLIGKYGYLFCQLYHIYLKNLWKIFHSYQIIKISNACFLLWTVNIPIFAIIAFESLLSSSLNSINKTSRIQLHQDGNHSINFAVKGEGFIAKMIRRKFTNVSSTEKLNIKEDNKSISFILINKAVFTVKDKFYCSGCMPIPKAISKLQLNWTLLLMFAITVLERARSLIKRTRIQHASRAFESVRQIRELYVYNSIVAERVATIRLNNESKSINNIDCFTKMLMRNCPVVGKCLLNFGFLSIKCSNCHCGIRGDVSKCKSCGKYACIRCSNIYKKMCIKCSIR